MKIVLRNSNLVFEKYQIVISDEVKEIMTHYVNAPAKSDEALQIFFNTIGDIKSKLIYMTLPMFASTNKEGLFDIVSKTIVHSGDPESANNDSAFTLDEQSLRCNNAGWAQSYFLYSRVGNYKHYQMCWATTFKEGNYKSVVFNSNRNDKTGTAFGGFLDASDVVNFRATRHFADGNSVKGEIYGNTSKSGFDVPNKTTTSAAGTEYQLYGSSSLTSGGFTSCVVGIDLTDDDMNTLRTALLKLHASVVAS